MLLLVISLSSQKISLNLRITPVVLPFSKRIYAARLQILPAMKNIFRRKRRAHASTPDSNIPIANTPSQSSSHVLQNPEPRQQDAYGPLVLSDAGPESRVDIVFGERNGLGSGVLAQSKCRSRFRCRPLLFGTGQKAQLLRTCCCDRTTQGFLPRDVFDSSCRDLQKASAARS